MLLHLLFCIIAFIYLQSFKGSINNSFCQNFRPTAEGLSQLKEIRLILCAPLPQNQGQEAEMTQRSLLNRKKLADHLTEPEKKVAVIFFSRISEDANENECAHEFRNFVRHFPYTLMLLCLLNFTVHLGAPYFHLYPQMLCNPQCPSERSPALYVLFFCAQTRLQSSPYRLELSFTLGEEYQSSLYSEV